MTHKLLLLGFFIEFNGHLIGNHFGFDLLFGFSTKF